MNAVAQLEATATLEEAYQPPKLSGAHMLNLFGIEAAKAGNYALAVKYFAPLADKKHVQAMHNLGSLIVGGHCPDRTAENGVVLLLKSAKRGNDLSRQRLSQYFSENREQIPFTVAGYKLCERAVNVGVPEATPIIVEMIKAAEILPGADGIFAHLPNKGGIIKISQGSAIPAP